MLDSEFKDNSTTLNTTLKLIGFLLFLIFIWVANLLIPVHTYHPIAYNLTYPARMIFVCYSMVIIFSIFIIRKSTTTIKNKDLIIAFTLGALGASTDIFLATTTILAYISSMIMLEESKTKVHFAKPIKGDGDTWFIVSMIFILYMFFYVAFNNFGPIPVSYALYHHLRPGITEEVMWRLFLFAVAMKITKGEFNNKYDKLLIWLILIVPFILLHVPHNYGGLGHPIGYISIFRLIELTPASIIVTWLFLKRSLLSAILFHSLGNAYFAAERLYNAGNDIFYWIQPSILEVVFGIGL